MVSDAMIEDFYQKTISGGGGLPPKGIIMDLVNKRGPAVDETEKVDNDGKGWVWLAADMSPGGLAVALYTAVPYGKRPLLVAKTSDVDGMFDKVNWNVVLERFEVT